MHEHDLSVAIEAARWGAAVVKETFGSVIGAEFKGNANPVTEVDRNSEDRILAVIRQHFPGDSVMAEESGGSVWDRGRVWLVDPLDGTVNFIHAIPHVSVSVALWIDGRPAAAVVIDVTRGEEFAATTDGGCRSGPDRVSVSLQTELHHSLIATGFAYDRNLHGASYAENLGNVLIRAQGVRRFGSAALDLGWVACGRYEGYWEFGVKPWDAAAGILLVAEAGGIVTNHHGDPYQLGESGIVASNGAIHDDLLAAVRIALPPHIR
ncbi:MAG: inositol monophosphatase family protein [Acidimicrobiia bacterium]